MKGPEGRLLPTLLLLLAACSCLAQEFSSRRELLPQTNHRRAAARQAFGREEASGGPGGSLTREERRRMREERRQARQERREERRRQKVVGADEEEAAVEEGGEEEEEVDLAWLRTNVSSLWREFRAFTRGRGRGHLGRGGGRERDGELEVATQDPAQCPPGENSCMDAGGEVCSGHGQCSCGHCQCHDDYYGSTCQCSDHTCQLYDGMMCGGPSRGQCRCGGCMCRPGYVGESCNCPTTTETCRRSSQDGICSGKGTCECGRCRCADGYKGMYCEDTVYAARVCENLKSCVLCKAWHRQLPNCDECQITVTVVESLELSMTTCVMVNSGCILKYSYIPQAQDAYSVLVERSNECPPRTT